MPELGLAGPFGPGLLPLVSAHPSTTRAVEDLGSNELSSEVEQVEHPNDFWVRLPSLLRAVPAGQLHQILRMDVRGPFTVKPHPGEEPLRML
jgi:hypothetical protein